MVERITQAKARDRALLTIGLVALLVLAAVVVPYLMADRNAPAGTTYSWVSPNNSADFNTYLAWAEQARRGAWLFMDLYAPEQHRPRLFNVYFLLMGRFAGLSGLSICQAAHVFRVLLSLALMLSLIPLVRRHISEPRHRPAALVLLILFHGSSGRFGAGAQAFWSMFENGLFVFSLILMIWAFLLWEPGPDQEPIKTRARLIRGAASGALILALALSHSYYSATVLLGICIALALRAVIQRRIEPGRLISSAPALAIGGLGAVYVFILYSTDPILSHAIGYDRSRDDLFRLLVEYHVLWPLALIGAIRGLRRGDAGTSTLAGWACACVILYWATGFGAKFLHGCELPLSLLALQGLVVLGELSAARGGQKKYAADAVVWLAVIAMCGGTARDWVIQARDLSSAKSRELYLPDNVAEAARWLKVNSGPGDVVLADPVLSNFLPALAGTRVVRGHLYQTPEYRKKAGDVRAMLAGRMPSSELFRKYNVAYVLSTEELLSGAAWDPEADPLLELVWGEAGDVAIYRIKEL